LEYNILVARPSMSKFHNGASVGVVHTNYLLYTSTLNNKIKYNLGHALYATVDGRGLRHVGDHPKPPKTSRYLARIDFEF
jgi:hypothetical protein